MASNLNIYLFNVRGLAEKSKRNTIFQHLKKTHKGILFLQETHSTVSVERKWKGEFGGEIFYSHGTSGSKGVETLVPKYINFDVHTTISDPDGRFILLEANINQETYVLCNVYAPTKDKVLDQQRVLEKLKNVIENFSDKNLIIGGDFNCCLDPLIDKRGGKIESVSWDMQTFISDLDLCDIWRVRNPNIQRFTHRQTTKSGVVFSRIDLFLISIHISYNVQDCDIHLGTHSDHSIIELYLHKNLNIDRGKGF